MRKAIPNLLTLANLFCGCFGIALVHSGNLGWAAIMVLAAAAFDFFDGFAARLLNAQSAIGEQLDSLSDLVSFGVLPAFLVYDLFLMASHDERWAKIYNTLGANSVGLFIFVFALSVALRLAVFNTSSNQSSSFVGIPSPAAGLTLASMPLIYYFGLDYGPIESRWLEGYVLSSVALLALVALLSILMHLPVRLMALKFKNFGLKENVLRYLLILSIPLFLGVFGFFGIQLIVLLYLILSIIQNIASHEI